MLQIFITLKYPLSSAGFEPELWVQWKHANLSTTEDDMLNLNTQDTETVENINAHDI
jgi:hypothetical protein